MTYFYENHERFCGWESNPNHFGLIVCIAFLAVFSVSLYFLRKVGKNPRAYFIIFIILAVLDFFFINLLLKTYSRGAMVATVIPLSFFVLSNRWIFRLNYKVLVPRYLVTLAVAFSIIVVVPTYSNRVESIVSTEDASISNRYLMWQYGGAMIYNHLNGVEKKENIPILFTSIHSPPPETGWQRGKYVVDNLVNTPLTIAYVYGIWVGSGYVFLMLLALYGYFSLKRKKVGWVIGISGFNCLLGYLLGSMFLWTSSSVMLSYLALFLCLGGLISLCFGVGSISKLLTMGFGYFIVVFISFVFYKVCNYTVAYSPKKMSYGGNADSYILENKENAPGYALLCTSVLDGNTKNKAERILESYSKVQVPWIDESNLATLEYEYKKLISFLEARKKPYVVFADSYHGATILKVILKRYDDLSRCSYLKKVYLTNVDVSSGVKETSIDLVKNGSIKNALRPVIEMKFTDDDLYKKASWAEFERLYKVPQ